MEKKVYTLNYWLKNSEGEVVDTSEGGEPMVFLLGSSQVIAGLQKAVEGREIGDRLEVTIPPELAYGLHRQDFVSTVPASMFDGVDQLAPGMKFQTNTGADMQVVKVLEVKDGEVTIDANHPLAGLTLNFELEVLDVRAATESELKSALDE